MLFVTGAVAFPAFPLHMPTSAPDVIWAGVWVLHVCTDPEIAGRRMPKV